MGDDENITEMLSDAGYSDKAIEYFMKKENIGSLDNPDQVTDLTGPCGDKMRISLKFDDGIINNAKIQVIGCPGAVVAGCVLVNLAKGKPIVEAKKIDVQDLYKEVEKLPDQKIHCAKLAIQTLRKALKEYESQKRTRKDGD